jgi:TonB family protein
MKSFIRILSIASIVLYSGMALWAEPVSKPQDFKKVYMEYLNLAKAGKWQESLPFIQQAYELNKNSGAENKKTAAALAYSYGENLEETRNHEEATRLYSEALAIEETVSGKDSPMLVPALVSLGRILQKTGREQESQRNYGRAILLAEKQYGAESVEFAKFFLSISHDFLKSGETAKTRKYLNSSYEILKKELGEKDPLVGMAAFHRAKYFMATGDNKKARDLLLETLNTFDNPDMPDNKVEMITHGFLVEVYERLGNREDATRHCLAIGRMTPITDNQNYFPVYKAMPEYPISAGRRKKEGYVIVEFLVNTSGIVESPKIVMTTDEVFNESSLEAAKKFRYAPKFVDGKPVSVAAVQNKIIYQMGK